MINVKNVESFDLALRGVVQFCHDNGNQQIDIVVPDKLSLFMEKYIFESLSLAASFNIKVYTFNRYAKQKVAVDKTNQITKTGSIILVHKILNEHLSEFSVLKNRTYSFSYAEEILNTINQLKASRIQPHELQSFKSLNPQFQGKINDLGKMYEYYETEKAGLLDASDLFLMSAFSIAEGKDGRKILLVGFDDFTAIEYALIERLALKTDVFVYNYASKNKNKNIYNNEVYSQLKNIALVNNIGFKVEDCPSDETGLKAFLRKNMFSLEKSNFCLEQETLKLFSGKDLSSEIEFVARDIRRKILEGRRYKEFGVAVYGLDANVTKIEEIFTKYEINYYLDNNSTINKSIFYKFLLSVIKYNLDDYSACHLIDIINSPFFVLPLERKNALIERLTTSNFRGKLKPEYSFGEPLKEDAEQLRDFLSLFDFDHNVLIDDFLDKIHKADEILHFEEVLNQIAEGCSLQSRIMLLKSKEIVLEIFDEIKKFYANANLDQIFDIFSHISSTISIPNLPLNLDAVKVVDASSCSEVFDDLYIINCTTDNAPNLKYDCGIILDAEIEKLNFAFKLSPTIAHINHLAKLRLYNLLLCFNKNLAITYSKFPADIVKELTEKISVRIDSIVVNLQPQTAFKFDKYLALSDVDYFEFLAKNDKNNKKIQQILGKNKNLRQIDEKSLKIYQDFNTVSASFLENYFKCPFYAFLNNTMKVRRRQESDLRAVDVGNILHEILFKYYSKKKRVGDIRTFCESEIINFVLQDEHLKIDPNSPLIQHLIEEAERVINGLDYIDSKSGFEPRFFEYTFKGKDALPLDRLTLNGKVDRIDAFDRYLRIVDYKSGKGEPSTEELYYGVKLQLFLYSRAVEHITQQRVVGCFYLPLHNNFERKETNTYTLKGFYEDNEVVVDALDKTLCPSSKSDIVNLSKLKDGSVSKRTNKVLTMGEFGKMKDYAVAVSNNAIDEIFSGFIQPTPSGVSQPCQYCPYAHICLKNSRGIDFRTAEKVKVKDFLGGENEGK